MGKQSLFRAALERYAAGLAGYVAAALGESTAREVAERLLRGAAGLQASYRIPGGCLTAMARSPAAMKGSRFAGPGMHILPPTSTVRLSYFVASLDP